MQKMHTCGKCRAAFIVIADPNGGELPVPVALSCPNCGERFDIDLPPGYNPGTVTILNA